MLCSCNPEPWRRTGARHFPAPEGPSRAEVEDSSRERAEKFEMKSGGEMYRDFPGLIRSSTPLYIKAAGIQVTPLLFPSWALTNQVKDPAL